MMCEKLYLPGAVEKNVVLSQLPQAVGQPVKVVLQLLKGIKYAAIGSQMFISHYVLECYQTTYVQSAWISDLVVRGIKVDH